MADINVTVASGFSVSSAFTVERPDRPLAIFVASGGGGGVFVEFATTSGTAPFYRLTPKDSTSFDLGFGACDRE